jgi:Zn-dependent protease
MGGRAGDSAARGVGVNFRLFGFPVEIQSGALIYAGIYLLFGIQAQRPIVESALGVLGMLGSVLLHELGHATMAQTFGLGPVSIVLHGFGGITRHRGSRQPWKDFLVTIAGPAAGLILALVAFLAIALPLPELAQSVLWSLVGVNVFWSLFNLLPLFPLDGGQALFAGMRQVAPNQALPATFFTGLLGGGALAAAALWLSFKGSANSIFLLFVAGMIVRENLQLRTLWRDRRAGR